jgi:hypothetical protein
MVLHSRFHTQNLPFFFPNRNCVYIVMGENVSRMVSSKSLSVSLHLPIHDASNSSSSSKKRVSNSNKLPMIASSEKPTKKRKYPSESIQTKTSSITVDLVHSEEEEEKTLDEEDSVSQCENNDETDILWDDESDSEEELEFVG